MSARQMIAVAAALVLSVQAQLAAAEQAPSTADSASATRVANQFLRMKMREVAPEIAKRALARARRAFVVGPFVSGAGAASLNGDSSGSLNGSVGGGVALTKFAIPLVPSKEALIERIKSKFIKLMLLRVVKGGTSDADVLKAAEEVWLEIKTDLLLELSPQRFEKPGFAARVEVNRLFDAKVWDVRLMAAIGVSKVFLGSGLVVRFDDDAVLAIPLELSVPMALSPSVRSPLLDFFARVDIVVAGDGVVENQALLGARLVLDVI